MKRFIFKEARVLALRRQQVIACELRVAETAAGLAAAQRMVASESEKIQSLSTQILASEDQGMTHLAQTSLSLRHRLELARERELEAQQTHADALQELMWAKVKAKALESLKEQRRRDYRSEVQKDDYAAADSRSTRAWLTEQRSND